MKRLERSWVSLGAGKWVMGQQEWVELGKQEKRQKQEHEGDRK